jgi:phospholipid/cholesterol/gamma-HCH transport system substrate-binding protein
MESNSGIGRVVALGAVAGAIVLVAVVLFTSGGGYGVTARFQNASQLVKGNLVQVGGSPVGTVEDITLTPNGQADIALKITDDQYTPLRSGTTAIVRQSSLSGIANRYVDLNLPQGADDSNPEIENGGAVGVEETVSPVDLDELFDTLDPVTRVAIQDFFQGSQRQLEGKAREANRGLRYLNPALSTTSRLLQEVNADTPVLEAFVIDSARLVTTLAERRGDVAGLIGNLNTASRAIGNQKVALAEALSRFPDFMRSANTTLVNLRSTLNQLDPLVNASKPVVSRPGSGNDLQELLPELRRFVANAEPTVKDLDRVVRRPGPQNDLIDATNSFPPLENIALKRQKRTVAPGGRKFTVNNGDPVDGAFPETAKALEDTTDIIAFGRPYTPALFGWFDDFSTTGAGMDAIGGISRAHTYLNATTFAGGAPINLTNLGLDFGNPALNAQVNALLVPVLQGAGLLEPGEELVLNRADVLSAGILENRQFFRCPGSAELPAPDKSNVLSASEQKELGCREDDRSVGDLP